MAAAVLFSISACAATAEEEGNERQLLQVEELGGEDPEGEPYQGDWKADVPLPAKVDHSEDMLRVRYQGTRGTCQTFAFLAALESYLGRDEHLSVEHFLSQHRLASSGSGYTRRFPGTKVVDEVVWPYAVHENTKKPKPAAVDSSPTVTMPNMISTGLGEEKLKKYLAESPKNNIALAVAWDTDFEQDNGDMVSMQLSSAGALARKLTCTVRAVCGGHMVLVVGYEERADSDGVPRTFFRFRNSWGSRWGTDGYGYMSSAYLRQMGISGFMLAEPR